ncbi:MAG: CoA transferase [Gammaproteobacteria bacterium]|nr:CoA transferase [Gammaproteobacteria bacterium]
MRPFEGIRVLDFTHVYAGPFATFQLAVMGAEVIKIEAPGMPDQMRSEGVDDELNAQGLGTNYYINNQGKKAISLNLDCDEGLDIATALIKTADVLVENYSGMLTRYGLGSKPALEINPGLVYCEMSGFDKESPNAGRPAYDPVIQAASGMMSLNGNSEQEFLRVGPPLIDYGMGAQTAFAIASALYQRKLTGEGQVIEANMLDAALVMMSPLLANAVHAGQTDRRTGNVQLERPGYSVYPCREGNIMIGAFTLKHHYRLFELLELDKSVDIPEDFDRDWVRDNGALLRERIIHCLAEKNADEWEQRLNAVDVPAARVRDLYEMLASEQVQGAPHSRFNRFHDERFSAPVTAFRFARHGPDLDRRCASHGEDNAVVLAELGYDAEAVARLATEGVI